MDITQLTTELRTTFSQSKLFPAAYVNYRQYLSMYRLHARVCGLFSRIGTNLGYTIDIGRRYPIDPFAGTKGRMQRQAEADVSFIESDSDNPVVLLDYETSDAPVDKMRQKFRYLSTFAKHSPTVEFLGFFITVTGVRHGWTQETFAERERFATEEIMGLIRQVCETSHNSAVTFLLGIFGPKELRLRAFRGSDSLLDEGISYCD